ncbi:MAG: type II toxin-antitoxin system RelE/ParE family toxin [Cytophagia bacterium]|nr:type II toxin-antitoxin system RelE/ParE family toxin [Cytophagia bacterium]
MQVIWTEKATNDYLSNIEYLLRKWSQESASNFIDEVDSILELLIVNPDAFPKTDYLEIRKVVIRKQISLFYKIVDDNIYILRLWNTYQNPESISF